MMAHQEPRNIIHNGLCGDRFKIYYREERFGAQPGDTEVIFASEDTLMTMFVISGTEIENFNKELKALFDKYRI